MGVWEYETETHFHTPIPPTPIPPHSHTPIPHTPITSALVYNLLSMVIVLQTLFSTEAFW